MTAKKMNEDAGRDRARSVHSTDAHLHELGIWDGSRIIVNKNRQAVAVKDTTKEVVPTVKLKHIVLGDVTDVRRQLLGCWGAPERGWSGCGLP